MSQEQKPCYQCNTKYSSLSKHWSMSTQCSYPNISGRTKRVIDGVLMGDGCLDRHSSKNGNIICVNTNRRYLEYLDDLFGRISRGVRLYKTAEQSSQSSGFSRISSDVENFSDIYAVNTISHPELNEYRSWYNSGKKEFPDDLSLSPETLKHWFVCDGTYDRSGNHNRVVISASNEINNEEKLRRYFSRKGLPEFSTFNTPQRKDGSRRCCLYWRQEASKEIFDYMGEPLPGFEYKWPERFK